MDSADIAAARGVQINDGLLRSFREQQEETEKKEKEIRAQKKIADDGCLNCGEKIEQERLNLGLIRCRKCAFAQQKPRAIIQQNHSVYPFKLSVSNKAAVF